MKLKAKDQIHVSSVQADSLRPGQEFEVSDDMGKQLMERHPNSFEQVQVQASAPAAPKGEKSEQAPQNKAEVAPANKADTGDTSKIIGARRSPEGAKK